MTLVRWVANNARTSRQAPSIIIELICNMSDHDAQPLPLRSAPSEQYFFLVKPCVLTHQGAIYT